LKASRKEDVSKVIKQMLKPPEYLKIFNRNKNDLTKEMNFHKQAHVENDEFENNQTGSV